VGNRSCNRRPCSSRTAWRNDAWDWPTKGKLLHGALVMTLSEMEGFARKPSTENRRTDNENRHAEEDGQIPLDADTPPEHSSQQPDDLVAAF
jgi:hypothetical protein